MTNPESPAFAKAAFYHPDGGPDSPNDGLTTREYMATKIMAALIINRPYPLHAEKLVNDALDMTDALIAGLNKSQEN